MQFQGEERFDQSTQVIWDRLTDMQAMARWMPDVEKVERADADSLDCVVRPGFSFIRGTLTMKLRVVEKKPIELARLAVEGKGIGSSVNVETTVKLSATPEGGTLLTWVGEVKELGGLLKPISKGLLVGAAQRVVSDNWKAFRWDLANN